MSKYLTVFLIMISAELSMADPMRPPNWATPIQIIETEPEEEDTEDNTVYELQQILKSQDRHLAIINGEVLSIGEQVGMATVRDIQNNFVTLRIGNKTLDLPLTDDTKERTNAQ